MGSGNAGSQLLTGLSPATLSPVPGISLLPPKFTPKASSSHQPGWLHTGLYSCLSAPMGPGAGGSLRGLQRDPNMKGASEARGSLRTQERRQGPGKAARTPEAHRLTEPVLAGN